MKTSLQLSKTALLLSIAMIHCGGAGAEPVAPTVAESSTPPQDAPKERAGEASIGAEFGGMNEAEVARAFASTYDALETCLEDGSQGMPYLAGAIHFYLEVDASGAVLHAHVEKSDLGDHDISQCMLGVLKNRTWPKPVGGPIGKIRGNRNYFPPSDVTPPTTWESDKVAPALEALAEPIAQCKAEVQGSFTATAYVGTIVQPASPEDKKGEPVEVGKIMAVDVIPPDKEGVGAIDCLIKALRSGTYPSPGQRPAKVTFSL